MLLTSVISGNKLVDLLSCHRGKASLPQLEIAGISAIRVSKSLCFAADVKDNAAQSNTGGGLRKCENSLRSLDADLLS
jgi:hypothetical protein